MSFLCLDVSAAESNNSKPKIGVLLPLSGELAPYGRAAQNGIELAKKEQPNLLSSVDFVVEDFGYDNKLAVAAYHKLIALDKVSTIYIWGYGPSQALVPVAEQDKFPLIACSAEPTVSQNKKYVIRLNQLHSGLSNT